MRSGSPPDQQRRTSSEGTPLLVKDEDVPPAHLNKDRKTSIFSLSYDDIAGQHPNVAIDEFGDVTAAVQRASIAVPRRDDPSVVALSRRSIYTIETVAEVKELQGIEGAKTFTSSFTGVVLQICLFLLSTLVGGLHPMVFEWCIWSQEHQAKRKDYIVGTVYVAYYSVSVMAGNILSLALYGKKGLKDCWNPKGQLLMIPAAAILAFVESLDGIIYQYLEGAMKAIVSQIRLPIVALIGVILLKRTQSALQWVLIIGVTVSVVGYSSISLTGKETVTQFGLWMAVFQACCGAVGTTVSEITLKKVKFPFCVQMSQARFVSAVASFGGLIIYLFRNEYTSLFVGWSYRIGCLVAWLAFRDWAMTSVLKALSALWKMLASGLALCISYVVETLVLRRSFDVVAVSFVLCLVIDILAYSLSRRQPKPASDSSQINTADKKDVEANVTK